MYENIRNKIIETNIENVRQACGLNGDILCLEGRQRLLMKSLFNILQASNLFTDTLYDPTLGGWRIEAAPRNEGDA